MNDKRFASVVIFLLHRTMMALFLIVMIIFMIRVEQVSGVEGKISLANIQKTIEEKQRSYNRIGSVISLAIKRNEDVIGQILASLKDMRCIYKEIIPKDDFSDLSKSINKDHAKNVAYWQSRLEGTAAIVQYFDKKFLSEESILLEKFNEMIEKSQYQYIWFRQLHEEDNIECENIYGCNQCNKIHKIIILLSNYDISQAISIEKMFANLNGSGANTN